MTQRPWSETEYAAVRERYRSDGAKSLARELGRSVPSVCKCAKRLGIVKLERWTEREDEQLRMFWGERPIRELSRILGRPESGIYLRAGKLGIRSGAPQGKEYLTHAAERIGVARETLRKILRWYGVRTSRPSRARDGAWSFGYVDSYDAERAAEAWFRTETMEEAARRHGWAAETLRRWLADAGKLPQSRGPKRHLRVEIAVVDEVVAEQTRIREERVCVTEHAERIGIGVNTLSRWLTEAGVPRSQFRPWVVDTETVDRVVAEHAARKTCRARVRLAEAAQ